MTYTVSYLECTDEKCDDLSCDKKSDFPKIDDSSMCECVDKIPYPPKIGETEYF